MDLFGALLFQVAGQQLSIAATRRILGKLQEHFSGRLPTARELRAMPLRQLRAAGFSRRKIATLRDLASRIVQGQLDERALRQRSDEEIEAELTQISGIGPWTVHGALIIAFDRDDVVLPGDLALRKVIQRTYRLDHLPNEGEVLAIAQPWRPHRSLATVYLFAAAYEAPR